MNGLRRWLLAGLLLVAAPAWAQSEVLVTLIIDDLGNDAELGRQALALPGAVTYSFLPHTPYAREQAEAAHALHREVMLHLPMQSMDNRKLGPGGLTEGMSEQHLHEVMEASLASVPHVSGVNNHMGSLLTRDSDAMGWVMDGLRQHGGLYFVDSRTTVYTVAQDLARERGVPNIRRDVFLDHHRDAEAIRYQFRRLIARARRDGHATAIGHPYPETLAVLAEELPRLAELGVRLVPASYMVQAQQRSTPQWLASSSPSPKAAKNSKPSPSSTCCDAPASK